MKNEPARPKRARKKATRYLAALAATATAAAGLAVATLPASAAPHRPAASPPGFPGRLYGGTAISSTDAWAVGLGRTGSLILHWNGKAWGTALHSNGFLDAAAATSAKDVWAVGGTAWFKPVPEIKHWNGKAWTGFAVPAIGGFLNSVTAITPTDAWAVGLIGNGPGDGTSNADKTLVLHWDGTSWTQVASVTPAGGGGLSSVSAVSSTDIWTVGWHGAGPDFAGTSRTLAEHWDGTAWTVVNTPVSKPGIRTELHGVLALSANNVWAVGGTRLDRRSRSYIVHWNGTQWLRVTAPTKAPDTSLYGIGGTSAGDLWAVGQTSDHGPCHPIKCAAAILAWNGKKWQLVKAPDPPSSYLNALWFVLPTGPDNVWAVGSTDYARTLIQRWNGKSWSGPN